MGAFIFFISGICLLIFIYKYFNRSESVYVSDKRFKTGRRFSHYRRFTDSEIAERKVKNKKRIKVTSIIMGVSLILMLIEGKDKPTEIEKASIGKNYSYELINSTKNNVVENYSIEIKSTDFSEKSVEKILREVKQELCKSKCNISAYDDKKYYELEEEMKSKKENLMLRLTNSIINKKQYKKELDKIDKEYYLKIADHLIGYLEFEDDGLFLYYPYQDWRYKELGGKNFKKESHKK